MQPLVNKVVDRLAMWNGRLMHHIGRLALIRTTLSAIPIYTSINLGLLGWMHKALIKIIRAFLQSGSEETHVDKCLVAWEHVQRPLHLGGLGGFGPQSHGHDPEDALAMAQPRR
jgi:hypothetical protein